MSGAAETRPSFFQRFLLPGLAFKGVVIGGGYATGRELVEFFLGSGPLGGLLGMLLAMAVWSLVCAVTFMFARLVSATDYRTFFQALLGPFWILFEIVYVLFLILVLAVMAAAAGSIGAATFGFPEWAGTVALMAAVVAVTTFGTAAAEGLFRYSSSFIYLVYGVFLLLALLSFGDRIGPQLAAPVPDAGWIGGGIAYASYNVIAAVAILPFLSHQTSQRDAWIAGLLSGPMAMLPAILFFLSMAAWYPEIGAATLPSDFLLRRIDAPWFYVLFQGMILCALLETGIGIVNAINARATVAAEQVGGRFPPALRGATSAILVVGSGVAATQIGLVALIAEGYGFFGYVILAIFVLPLATIGVARILKPSSGGAHVPT